jgi:phage terminase large subunit-like protein
MRKKTTYLILGMALISLSAQAQHVPTGPSEQDMYCSGVVTTQAPASDFYVISGPESATRVTYEQGDVVYLNKGASQGLKVGDEFLVTRPVSDPLKEKWFDEQPTLLQAMGQTYEDVGHLRVVNVQPSTSIAEVLSSCDLMQRGDLVQAFVERPAPPYKPEEKFDRFAPVSGKAKATIVTTRVFGQAAYVGATAYVNLGAAQGVKVGDYFRVFRYQGQQRDVLYQPGETAYKVFGYGATPVPYNWSELPRDVVGEGIVVRVGPNASSVLITVSRKEIFVGDYVELE